MQDVHEKLEVHVEVLRSQTDNITKVYAEIVTILKTAHGSSEKWAFVQLHIAPAEGG